MLLEIPSNSDSEKSQSQKLTTEAQQGTTNKGGTATPLSLYNSISTKYILQKEYTKIICRLPKIIIYAIWPEEIEKDQHKYNERPDYPIVLHCPKCIFNKV